jgi:hypothetical protein
MLRAERRMEKEKSFQKSMLLDVNHAGIVYFEEVLATPETRTNRTICPRRTASPMVRIDGENLTQWYAFIRMHIYEQKLKRVPPRN